MQAHRLKAKKSARQNRPKIAHLLVKPHDLPRGQLPARIGRNGGKQATRDWVLAKEKVASSNLVFRSKVQ